MLNILLNTLLTLLALAMGGVVLALFVVESMGLFTVCIAACFVVLACLFVASTVDHNRRMAAIRTRYAR